MPDNKSIRAEAAQILSEKVVIVGSPFEHALASCRLSRARDLRDGTKTAGMRREPIMPGHNSRAETQRPENEFITIAFADVNYPPLILSCASQKFGVTSHF
jgi:hypothetical protein